MEKKERVTENEVKWAERVSFFFKWLNSFTIGFVTIFLIIFWVWLYYQ